MSRSALILNQFEREKEKQRNKFNIKTEVMPTNRLKFSGFLVINNLKLFIYNIT